VDHLPPLGFVADRLIGANISANNEHAGEHEQDSDSYDGFHLCVISQVAQWGNMSKALEWLEKALRPRDPGLSWLKADPLMDPLRKEPRFQAAMRELKFPQ
jgi:hypothetical protein